jgi:hypothetical protein
MPSFTVLSFTAPGAPDVACRGEAYSTTGVTKSAGEVTALASAFTALSQNALPPRESADLIRHLADCQLFGHGKDLLYRYTLERPPASLSGNGRCPAHA